MSYDPKQPRVPAGHYGGGQWTDGKDRQLSKLQAAFARPEPALQALYQPALLQSLSHDKLSVGFLPPEAAVAQDQTGGTSIGSGPIYASFARPDALSPGRQVNRPAPGQVPPTQLPPMLDWQRQTEQAIMRLWKFFLRSGSRGGSAGKNEKCLDRWEGEYYGHCDKFRPFGEQYQRACRDRANDRLKLCYRNGGKPDPNEPPEYDWHDIPRDPAGR